MAGWVDLDILHLQYIAYVVKSKEYSCHKDVLEPLEVLSEREQAESSIFHPLIALSFEWFSNLPNDGISFIWLT